MPDVYEITISNDNSPTEEFSDGLDWWEGEDLLPLGYIGSDHQTSFAENVNRGVLVSSGDVLVVTQDDVIIRGDFRKDLLPVLDKHCVAGRLLDWDTGWNKFGNIVVPYIEGWFIACYQEVWEDIGGMDENIKPYDAEDIDFSISARQKGYDLINFDPPYLQHIGGQTLSFNEGRRRITEKNVEYVKNKWRGKLEDIYE